MIKGILSLIALAFTINSFSQSKATQLESSFRILGGYNIANMTFSDNGDVSYKNNMNSFHAGIICDLPISTTLSFQGGLVYSGKGIKSEFGIPGQNGYYKTTTNPMYLEMPLQFVGKIPIVKGIRVLVGAGGYGAMGVLGKNKTELQSNDVVVYGNRDIDFEEKDNVINQPGYPKMKRFDYGINGLAGFEFTRFTLTGTYSRGLANVIPGNATLRDNGKHRVLMFTFGLKI